MPRTTCADNLTRLGEMLIAAAQYSDLYDAGLAEDDACDVEGAYNRIGDLRVCQGELKDKLDVLELRLQSRFRELNGVGSQPRSS
jgi:hypothetical protein